MRWLTLTYLLMATPCWAHLLNMTEVLADIDTDGSIRLSVELDLLSEFTTPERYYQATLSDPLMAPSNAMFIQLANAIDVVQDNERIELAVEKVQWPSGYDLEDYQSQISWPKTSVWLTGRLGSGSPVTIRFTPGFVFEEPISLTLRAIDTGARKTRWLVADQTSPRFHPGNLTLSQQRGSLEDRLEQTGLFILHGFSHIIRGGWDHLLFLLALCLSTNSIRQLILWISLFTLAHTLTLGMASYRLIEFNPYWVELAIIGSIVFVAIKNLRLSLGWAWPFSPMSRAPSSGILDTTAGWIFGFGLLHGLGFASSLQAMEAGGDHFLFSLLGFNVGVELAQIGFILVAMGLLTALDSSRYSSTTRQGLSSMTAVIACVWFIQILVQA